MSAPLRMVLATAFLAPLTGLVGCEDDARDPLAEFRGALPDEATLEIELPDGEAATVTSGLEVREAPLVGEPSTVREHTARARRFLRSTVLEMLDSFVTLAREKPARFARGRAVWHRQGTVSDVEHLMVMNKEDDGHFTMSVWVRDAVRHDWRILVFGSLTPSETLGDGRGAMWIDLDNDMKPKSQGKVIVLFAALGTQRELDVIAFDARTEDQQIVTRGYRFRESGGAGSLAFDAGLIDIHARPDRPGLERVRAITRWDASGRFRGDFAAMGGEVASDGLRAIVGSECWAAGDGRVLYEEARGLRPVGEPLVIKTGGDLAACPAGRAAVPALPEPGTVPSAPEPPAETGLDWGK